ncbi:MAG TPA: glycosyltransferase family 4 protein [Opitutaceae bacterium]
MDPGFSATFTWDVDLLSGYDSEFVPNLSRRPGAGSFFGFRNPTLAAQLAAWEPDSLLVFGYNSVSHIRSIIWAKRRGIRLIFRGDSHLLGRGGMPPVKRFVLTRLYSAFDAMLFVGNANREYFKYLGVPDGRLYFAPHSVNASQFDPAGAGVRVAAERWRIEIGVAPAERVVLFAGKFLPAKQPLELLRAYCTAPRPGWVLIFVGSGTEEEALRRAAAESPAGCRVLVLPFANQSEMPSRYLASELFVLPSKGHYETWGLAVNEAMHMGIPCLVSDLVGCQRDLVADGETGWVFDPDKNGALANSLGSALDALSNGDQRERIKSAARERISHYGYAEAANGLERALSGEAAGKLHETCG